MQLQKKPRPLSFFFHFRYRNFVNFFSSQSFNEAGETENIYNVTPDLSKASIFIISQVGEHRIQVTVTLTSKAMREDPATSEGGEGEGQSEEAPANQEAASECTSRREGTVLKIMKRDFSSFVRRKEGY